MIRIHVQYYTEVVTGKFQLTCFLKNLAQPEMSIDVVDFKAGECLKLTLGLSPQPKLHTGICKETSCPGSGSD